MSMYQLRSFERREEASLPLQGYVQLYEAHLRSERKSPKTIQAYKYALERLQKWHQGEHGHEPTLADFNGNQVRFFLAAAQDAPKWQDTPSWRRIKPAISLALLSINMRVASKLLVVGWPARATFPLTVANS